MVYQASKRRKTLPGSLSQFNLALSLCSCIRPEAGRISFSSQENWRSISDVFITVAC